MILISKLSQVLPKDKLTVTQRGIQFKVPGILPPQEVITITIGMNDVLKVLQSLFVCISKNEQSRCWLTLASPCLSCSSTFLKMLALESVDSSRW